MLRPMTHANTNDASRWSHIRDLLATILARVGTPFRLALTPLDHAAKRELTRQISNLEDSVRQSLALIIARLVLIPHIAAACARRLAEKAQGSGAGTGPSFNFDLPEPRASEDPPVFRYLVGGGSNEDEASDDAPPQTAASRPQSSTRQTQRRQKRPRTMPADIPNLPLATRLAAVEHVIDNPEAAARDILRRHPHLAFSQPDAPTPASLSPARKPKAEPYNVYRRDPPSSPHPAEPPSHDPPHTPPNRDTS